MVFSFDFWNNIWLWNEIAAVLGGGGIFFDTLNTERWTAQSGKFAPVYFVSNKENKPEPAGGHSWSSGQLKEFHLFVLGDHAQLTNRCPNLGGQARHKVVTTDRVCASLWFVSIRELGDGCTFSSDVFWWRRYWPTFFVLILFLLVRSWNYCNWGWMEGEWSLTEWMDSPSFCKRFTSFYNSVAFIKKGIFLIHFEGIGYFW